MRVAPGIDLVGSGWLGFGLSHSHDCHVYLLHSEDEAVLVDAGCGLDPAAIVANIAAAGVAPASVSRVLVTHAHPDHAAGAHELADRLGAQVLGSTAVADILARGDEDAAGLTRSRAAGLYPAEVALRPTPTSELRDGDVVRVGRFEITAVTTPGHAAGHLCFLASGLGQRVLLSGDLVFTRGRVALQGTPDCDLQQHWQSLRRVQGLTVDVLLPGHETLGLRDGQVHLDAAVAALERQEIPPPLLP